MTQTHRSPLRSPAMLFLAAALAGLAAWMLHSIDHSLVRFMHDRAPQWTAPLGWVSEIGFGLLWLAGFFVAALVVFRRGKFDLAARLFDAWVLVAASGLLVNLIKWLTYRPRPWRYLETGDDFLQFYTEHLTNNSFPSGHSATIAAVSLGLCRVAPRRMGLWIVLGGVALTARALSLHHYASDVAAGVTVTLFTAALVAAMRRRSDVMPAEALENAVASHATSPRAADAAPAPGAPLVTVIIVPRERFSHAVASLDNVLSRIDHRCELIYVDGNSPPHVAQQIAERACRHRFRLVRTEHYLFPNEARNLVVNDVTTPWVLFLDNDVELFPGFLDALLTAGERTGADIVSPLYLDGRPEDGLVHMAGGDSRITIENGVRVFHEKHHFFHRKLAEVADQIHAGPTETAEFHGMLVRTGMLRRITPLPPTMIVHDHVDVCLHVRALGGAIYTDPAAKMTYVFNSPHCWSDLPYYQMRWSQPRGVESFEFFFRKWRLDPVASLDPGATQFLLGHRRRPLRIFFEPLRALLRPLGRRRRDRIVDWCYDRTCDYLANAAEATRPHAVAPVNTPPLPAHALTSPALGAA